MIDESAPAEFCLHEVVVPADFMAERPLNVLPKERGIFDDEVAPGHALPAHGRVDSK